jgi:phosphatidylethanolamine-binding protein (PEBP) family uncharacterized protein
MVRCRRNSALENGCWVELPMASPLPPPSHGPRRYVFQMFALKQALSANVSFDRKALLREMNGKIFARGRLTGLVERK